MTPAAATPTAPRPDERSNAGHPGGGHAFGVDIGGSGIKGAPVDLDTGLLATDRLKLPTPQPSTPEAVAETVAKIVEHFDWHGPIGATFPAVVTNGVARTAANVDHAWIGTDVSATLSAAAGVDVTVINDADAAGLAEVSFGAAAGHDGLVVITTLGTGIGTALIHGGVLIPNSELGHIELDGHDIETQASAGAREREDLSWSKWAKRLDRYFQALEAYLWPELFVIGGGVSRKGEKFIPLLNLRTPIVAATLHNEAGIVGAALAAVGVGAGRPGSRDAGPSRGEAPDSGPQNPPGSSPAHPTASAS